MKKKILLLASANRDLIVEMDRMPAPGETHFGLSYGYACGGKGSNAAVAMARQGAEVTIVTCLGDDDNGHALLESYKREGMDTRAVRMSKDFQTGFAVCTVEHDGNSRIIVIPGANKEISFRDVPSEILAENFDAVMTQFEVPFDAVKDACHWAAGRDIPVIIDAGPASALPLEELEGVTVFSPNETETSILTGGMPVETEADWLAAARRLMERTKAEQIVLKLGARGAYVWDGKDGTFLPAFKIDAVDATAAGDSFTAAYSLAWLDGASTADALTRGNAGGALAAMRMGAQPSLPTDTEIDEFLKKH